MSVLSLSAQSWASPPSTTMSIRNEDNAVSHHPNNNSAEVTGLLTVPSAPHLPSNLHSSPNANPASTQTSVTRVHHNEKAVIPPPITDGTVSTLGTTSDVAAPRDVSNSISLSSPVREEVRAVAPQLTPVPSSERDEPLVGEAAEDSTVPQSSQTYVTFLLISGKRRTLSFEPSTTIVRVKELAWNSWPADWQDERPPAPSYLRVLYLGRMLQDDETLQKLKLPVSSSSNPLPTIMHLSIRPYALSGPEDGVKKKKKRGRSDTSGSDEGDQQTNGAGCCRCIIC